MNDASSVQEFVAAALVQAAADLAIAYRRIPEDKRDWAPEGAGGGKPRSARSQVVECALVNGYTADLLGAWRTPPYLLVTVKQDTAAASALDDDALLARLVESASRAAAAARAVPTAELGEVVRIPVSPKTWDGFTVGRIAAHGYWNMTYHLGQVNLLALMLGCLE
jgi:hypothetical protein